MSQLLQHQKEFALDVAQLIIFANSRGYRVTLGEAWRTPEQAIFNMNAGKGISNSLHLDRLAIDLNLFLGDRFLQDSDSHRPLGNFWKSLHLLNRWGGDFRPKQDGNHYSREYNGRK